MGYYLQDNRNQTPQFGWPRKKVSGVVGVHTAENSTDFEGADPGAEAVSSWLTRRADYGSYHAIADADSRIKLVHPQYAAWADTTNNAHAMSVSGAMQAARWRDLTPERAAAITRNMAYAAADLVKDAVSAGLLSSPTPARRITPTEAISGSRAGFYGHGETNPGTRYDPGQNFDWALFLSTYAAAVGLTSSPSAPQQTIRGDGEIHWVVERGDTLGKIQAYYNGPSVAQIATYNNIDPNRIYPGQKIWIPGPLVWIIEAPDTIRSIAAYYGLDPAFLARQNGLAGPDATIYIGNRLTIKA